MKKIWAIELPDGTLYPRRWWTAEAAGRYLATAPDIRSGNVVNINERS